MRKVKTKIYCRSCGKYIYNSPEIIHIGDVIDAGPIYPVRDYLKPNTGDDASCPYCKSGLVMATFKYNNPYNNKQT